jgi:hypothetical protein
MQPLTWDRWPGEEEEQSRGAPSLARRAAQMGKPVAKALIGAAGQGMWSLIENTPKALGMGLTVGGHAFRAVNSGLDAVEDVYGMLTHREADPMAIVDQQQSMARMRPDYAHDLPDLEQIPAEAGAAAAAQYVDVDVSPPKRKKKGNMVHLDLEEAKAKVKAKRDIEIQYEQDWSHSASAPAATSVFDILHSFRKRATGDYDQEEEVRGFHQGTPWGY